jgi:hypothetical protein
MKSFTTLRRSFWILIFCAIFISPVTVLAQDFVIGTSTGTPAEPVAGRPVDECAGGVILDDGTFESWIGPVIPDLSLVGRFSLGDVRVTRVCIAFTSTDDGVSSLDYNVVFWTADGAGGTQPGSMITSIPAATATGIPFFSEFQWYSTAVDVELAAGDVFIGFEQIAPLDVIRWITDTDTPNDFWGGNEMGWTPFSALFGTDATSGVRIITEPREEESRATFNVNKYFDDNNPAEVAVTISCDTGLPLEQTKMISRGHPVEFVVVDFDDGELDCDITEATPLGYSANYESNGGLDSDNGVAACRYNAVGFEEDFTCDINNSLNQVGIVVRKIWIDDNPQFNTPNYARARWNCYNSGYDSGADDAAFFGCDGDTCGSLSFYGADSTDSFSVYPDWDGSTYCTVEERVFESGVETSSNCGRLYVAPGQGNACTITNTRFYEGIPTLSQYGLAILALLMLGMGMVGFRRFV